MAALDDPRIRFTSTRPIFRIFSIEKARDFYVDWLGFAWDWTHQVHEGSPIFAQVSRGDLVLHLSEHHGDGSPGVHINVYMRDIEALHREIATRPYRFMNPGLELMPWGMTLGVIDPFGNRITFIEPPG